MRSARRKSLLQLTEFRGLLGIPTRPKFRDLCMNPWLHAHRLLWRAAPLAISSPPQISAMSSMSLARGPAKILTGDIFAHDAVQIAPASEIAGDRTRPILKIQDGCNNRCSYCVIPFVRGRSRSLPPDAVVEEVRKLVSAGAKEVVLSGINLGSYGRDLPVRTSLAGIVGRILDETHLEQLRFSSIEPQDVTEDFVALVAESGRIAHHFHIPLQSGSNRILRAMHRWYRAELYAERMKLIRRLLPDAAIGADVIVGFPGETDEDFRATAGFHRATAVHVPARIFILCATRNESGKSCCSCCGIAHSGTGPVAASARAAEISRVPRIAGGPHTARAHACALWRRLDRSSDWQLSKGANRGPVPRE